MKISERTIRISASTLLALFMVSAAYLLSGPNFLTSKFANAESTDELLKAYSTKDTDADGLPDWQEALYGTDPNKAISNSFGISDGEAVRQGKLNPNSLASQLPSADQGTTTPLTDADFGGTPAPAAGSITEQFSQEFLQEITSASGGQTLDDAATQSLATNLFAKYSAKSAAMFSSNYSIISLHTNSSLSVNQYVDSLETILKSNEVEEGAGDPIVLMDDLVNKNDKSARPKIVRLAKAYGQIRDQLLAAPVPPSLSDEHIELVRSFDSLAKATTAVSAYEKDPLGILGGLAIYEPSDKGIAEALQNISKVILANGEPAPGAPGAYILSAVRLTEKQ